MNWTGLKVIPFQKTTGISFEGFLADSVQGISDFFKRNGYLYVARDGGGDFLLHWDPNADDGFCFNRHDVVIVQKKRKDL